MAVDVVAAEEIDEARSGPLVVGLLLAVATVLADSSVVVLALPDVLSAFDVSIERVSWVITAYNLVLALAAVPAAYLATRAVANRRRGRRPRRLRARLGRLRRGRELRPPARRPLRPGGQRRAGGLRGAAAAAAAARLACTRGGRLGGRRGDRSGGRAGRGRGADPGVLVARASSPPRCRWRSCRCSAPVRGRVAMPGETRWRARAPPRLAEHGARPRVGGAHGGALSARPRARARMGPLPACGRRRADGDPGRGHVTAALARSAPARPACAAAGVILIAGGLAALALVPSASIGWTFLPQALIGAGLALTLPGLTREALAGAGSLAIHGGWTIGARHAGVVVGLLILTPIFTADLVTQQAAAERSGAALVLNSRLSLQAKLRLGDAIDQSLRTTQNRLPDLGPGVRRAAPLGRRPADLRPAALGADRAGAAGGDARVLARVPGRRGDRAPRARPAGRRTAERRPHERAALAHRRARRLARAGGRLHRPGRPQLRPGQRRQPVRAAAVAPRLELQRPRERGRTLGARRRGLPPARLPAGAPARVHEHVAAAAGSRAGMGSRRSRSPTRCAPAWSARSRTARRPGR